ncbi:hypothetical protein [Rhizobium sp. 11515TR]|uniref:hypothetical protein n=1 Tax=Rhizobium sp. 11515TR TaxID=2028343 RepID=UPI0013047783|nr:hypothetical protein [Rhizobium sp. 11515TR]
MPKPKEAISAFLTDLLDIERLPFSELEVVPVEEEIARMLCKVSDRPGPCGL